MIADRIPWKASPAVLDSCIIRIIVLAEIKTATPDNAQ